MTEQEQMKKWEEEFCEFAKDINPEILVYEGNLAWQAFLYAKRSQPLVVLPKPIQTDGFRYWTEMDIDHALTAAGIEFKVED